MCGLPLSVAGVLCGAGVVGAGGASVGGVGGGVAVVAVARWCAAAGLFGLVAAGGVAVWVFCGFVLCFAVSVGVVGRVAGGGVAWVVVGLSAGAGGFSGVAWCGLSALSFGAGGRGFFFVRRFCVT